MDQQDQATQRKRPDFNAMSRGDLVANFGDMIDRSDFTGKGDKRHPHEFVGLYATRGEINAAISQSKGVESLDLGDGQGRRKSVVDSLRTFMPAIRVKEYTKGTREEPAKPTGRVMTGVAGLEAISAGFGKGSSRLVGLDRDAAKTVVSGIAERADVQESILQFRAAMAESFNRKQAIEKARRPVERVAAEVGR